MRALGDAMGVDATALYRHYPSKDDLINAMVDWLMGEVLANVPESSADPREQVTQFALTARQVFRLHPEIAIATVKSKGGGARSRDVMISIIEPLTRMGLSGNALVRCYQMLEGFVVGSCVQDFARSPQNFAIRRARYRWVEVRDFDDASSSEQTVSDIADEAFAQGLEAMIHICAAQPR